MNFFKMRPLWAALALVALFSSCAKQPEAVIHFRLKFDSLQERLGADGLPTGVTSGRAAQTPAMNALGIHQIEFLPSSTTPFGKGTQLFASPETTVGGDLAIDFSQAKIAKDGEIFLDVPMSKLPVGKYEWARVSVAYQNYDVLFNLLNVPFAGSFNDERGAVASFVGFNNYITTYKVATKTETINANRKQGYWCFETKLNTAYAIYDKMYNGQSLDGATTVVNPLAASSPIPAGSCVVTGRFDTPLSISGKETTDLTVTLSFSINRSFEWEETINRNGKWDINAQANTGQPTVERVVDMGLRGLRVFYESK